MKRLIILFISIILSSGAVLAVDFPQELVDMVCFERMDSRAVLLDAIADYRGVSHSIMEPRQFSIPETFALTDLVVGPGADTVIIDTNHVQDGEVYVLGDGVLIIDGAYFSVAGQVGAAGNGKIYVRNGATLHFHQSWVGQYSVWLFENSYFEATDATIDANNVMHFVETHDDATYIARRCYYPDWTFKKFFERSTVIMEDVAHIGDMMVGDSSNIHLIRCDTLMPWFQAPDGSVIDIEFPEPDSVEHFEFHSGVDGISGVGEHFVLDTCARCWWSFETYPGCSVTVRNSEIRGCAQRIPGADTFSIYGIRNYNFNTNLVVPLSDRHLQFITTYNYWWNWYPWENTVFFIDSCVFGEMICSNTATIFATRCVHDGSTITLATKDSSFMSFEAGTSYAFAGSFQQSTLLMKDTYITPLWPYQATNIAHHNSQFLCVNCDFDSLPFALDTALVMWVAIDFPEFMSEGDSDTIYGSAWISVGPENPVDFERYRVYIKDLFGLDEWILLKDSTEEVHDGILCRISEADYPLWETEYELRLTIWTTEGDSLSALTRFFGPGGVKISQDVCNRISLDISPNPFNSSCAITAPENAEIEIYDLRGNVVTPYSDGKPSSFVPLNKGDTGDASASTQGVYIWQPDESISSGIYLVRARMKNCTCVNKQIVYLK